MYHIFFIHASVNGHLDRFHVLAIVNNAMNIPLEYLTLRFVCTEPPAIVSNSSRSPPRGQIPLGFSLRNIY